MSEANKQETHFWRVVDGTIREHYGNVSMFEIHRMIGSHDLESTLARSRR